MKTFIGLLLGVIILGSCNSTKNNIPVIGFADAFEDNTIEQAKLGFFDALKEHGYSEDDHTIKIIYRNAENDIPKLTLSIKYFISENVTLIAANPSLSTIAALQNTKDIPVFMMVSPTPQLMNVMDKDGNAPSNLFGVAESLDYIDTSFSMIPKLLKHKDHQLRVGMIYNQSEPQSASALKRIQELAVQLKISLICFPVNNTADVQMVTQALLSKNIDAFFANPDNTVFGSFETILKACNDANVPVFTSEAGLVSRGAVAAYGADIYQWGFQAGEQAALFLKNKSTDGLHWEMVKFRKHVYNSDAAKPFDINFPQNFEDIK
jgi:putative ABC transport system substrate-binding protein